MMLFWLMHILSYRVYCIVDPSAAEFRRRRRKPETYRAAAAAAENVSVCRRASRSFFPARRGATELSVCREPCYRYI